MRGGRRSLYDARDSPGHETRATANADGHSARSSLTPNASQQKRKSIVEQLSEDLAKQEIKTEMALMDASAATADWEEREGEMQDRERELKAGLGRMRSMINRQDSAQLRFDREYGRASDKSRTSVMYDTPVVVAQDFLGGVLGGGDDARRVERLEAVLKLHEGVPVFSRLQAALDAAAFSEPPSGVITHACASLRICFANMYDAVHKILTRVPPDRAVAVKDTFEAFASELRGTMSAVDTIADCASTCQDELDDAVEELARLRERELSLKDALSATTDVLCKVRSDTEERLAEIAQAPAVRGGGVKAARQSVGATAAFRKVAEVADMAEAAAAAASPLLTDTTGDEVGIVLLQIEGAAFLRKSGGKDTWQDTMRTFREVVASVAPRFGASLLYPTCPNPPTDPETRKALMLTSFSGHDTSECLSWAEWVDTKPSLVNVAMCTHRPEQAVWLCTELHRAILVANWPSRLLRYSAAERRRSVRPSDDPGEDPFLWGGLRVRCAAHAGPCPTMARLASGAEAPAVRKCARILEQSHGGEVLVSHRLWMLYSSQTSHREGWTVQEKAASATLRFEELAGTMPHCWRVAPEELVLRWKQGQFNETANRFDATSFALVNDDGSDAESAPRDIDSPRGEVMLRVNSLFSGASFAKSSAKSGRFAEAQKAMQQRQDELFTVVSNNLGSVLQQNKRGVLWYLERAEEQLMSMHDRRGKDWVAERKRSAEEQALVLMPDRKRAEATSSRAIPKAHSAFKRAVKILRQQIAPAKAMSSLGRLTTSGEPAWCLRHLHRVVRLMPELLQRMTKKDVTALSGEQAASLFAQSAQIPGAEQVQAPWREKFNVMVARTMDTDDLPPARLVESGVAHLGKVLMLLKQMKRTIAFEGKRTTSETAPTKPVRSPQRSSISPGAAAPKRKGGSQFQEFGMMQRQKELQERWRERKGVGESGDHSPPTQQRARLSRTQEAVARSTSGASQSAAEAEAAAKAAREAAEAASLAAASLTSAMAPSNGQSAQVEASGQQNGGSQSLLGGRPTPLSAATLQPLPSPLDTPAGSAPPFGASLSPRPDIRSPCSEVPMPTATTTHAGSRPQTADARRARASSTTSAQARGRRGSHMRAADLPPLRR